MKKVALGMMLLIACAIVQVPTIAKADSWGMSLNPAGVWRFEGQRNIYDGNGGWISLSGGDASAIYARAVNSQGAPRTGDTYVSKGDSSSFKNVSMETNYKYNLNCKNNTHTSWWVWASGSYDW